MTATKSDVQPQFIVGEPRSFRGLGLIPLFAPAEVALEYIGLDEATSHGLIVTELDEAGAVETLFVTNPLELNVLLFEGEELIGAKQNRILQQTILVSGKTRVPIPVHCVERGRWSYRDRRFRSAPRAAHPEVRRASRFHGQGAVWEAIGEKAARLGAYSPTEAQEELFLTSGSVLADYVEALPRLDGQCGAIVSIGGEVVCLDFVSRSDVYAGLHSKLLCGYALDALERPEDVPVPVEYARRLVSRISGAQRSPAASVGLGKQRMLVSSRFRGFELVVGDELVAMSVFPGRRT